MIKSKSKSGNYEIWKSRERDDLFTVLPLAKSSHDYEYYQEKNVEFINYLLGLVYNEENKEEILSQLNGYNYKLINRIQTKEPYSQETVPYRLADVLINKNVNAFLYFFNQKTKGKIPLGIKNIRLNHTQHGSFVIPVSIELVGQETFPTIPSQINKTLRDYLDVVDLISGLDMSNEEKFASSVLENDLDSTLVRNFIDSTSSVAFYKKEYSDFIQNVSISGRSNPILDYQLERKYKNFPEVSLAQLQPASVEFFEYLERKETERDEQAIYAVNTTIEVIVDALDRGGKVKFSVVAVGAQRIDKPFKASIDEQPQVRLNEFASAFITGEVLELNGDIRKPKHKLGKILVHELKRKNPKLTLLDDITEKK